jgi:hypothetical protein
MASAISDIRAWTYTHAGYPSTLALSTIPIPATRRSKSTPQPSTLWTSS